MAYKETQRLLADILKASRRKQFAGLSTKVATLPATSRIQNDKRLVESFVWSGLSSDLELVRAFLALGLSINTVFKGHSILGFGARIPFPEFVHGLLSLGADPDHEDSEGATPLVHVARIGSRKPDAREYYLPNVEQLASATTKVNIADTYRDTALDCCCKGMWDTASLLLLEKGAQLSACDEDGWWALLWSVQSMETTVLSALLQHDGATSVAERSSEGFSVISFAAQHGCIGHVEAMLTAGVSDRLPDGRSARAVAGENKHEPAIIEATLAQLGIVRGRGR